MIAPEQLAAALARLDPRDWEVLDLSLRRRVPDDALADMLGVETQEVARRRAAAVERLTDDLDIQRGYDLGAVLQALLEEDTWAAAEAQADRRGAERPSPPPAAAAAGPAAEPSPQEARPRSISARRALIGAAAAVAILALAGGAAAVVLGGGSDEEKGSNGSETRPFAPRASGPIGIPFPSDPNVSFKYLTAHIRKPAVLYSSPGGPRKLRIPAKTEWGSPRVLSVVRERGPWLGVVVPELRNGELGWLPAHSARLGSVEWAINVDRSRKRLEVRRNDRVVRRARIAVGAPGHRTPLGRFAVTDKLNVKDPGSPYGCCVLALTGHQTHLPPDWPGGDRLAIHATKDSSSIGRAVSLGCMRVSPAQGRWLVRRVPAGTPVFVRR